MKFGKYIFHIAEKAFKLKNVEILENIADLNAQIIIYGGTDEEYDLVVLGEYIAELIIQLKNNTIDMNKINVLKNMIKY